MGELLLAAMYHCGSDKGDENLADSLYGCSELLCKSSLAMASCASR